MILSCSSLAVDSATDVCIRDGTGRDFRDPTGNLSIQPAGDRQDLGLLIFDRALNGRMTGKIYNI